MWRFQLPPHNPFDLNLALVLAGLRQVISHLQPQPRFRTTTERLVETDRHLRRNTALAVYKIVEGLPRHAQNVCSLSPASSPASTISAVWYVLALAAYLMIGIETRGRTIEELDAALGRPKPIAARPG